MSKFKVGDKVIVKETGSSLQELQQYLNTEQVVERYVGGSILLTGVYATSHQWFFAEEWLELATEKPQDNPTFNLSEEQLKTVTDALTKAIKEVGEEGFAKSLVQPKDEVEDSIPDWLYDLIIAQNNGSEIEFGGIADVWITIDLINPDNERIEWMKAWGQDHFRIKPEPKPDIIKFFQLESHPLAGMRFTEVSATQVLQSGADAQHLEVTFEDNGVIKGVKEIK